MFIILYDPVFGRIIDEQFVCTSTSEYTSVLADKERALDLDSQPKCDWYPSSGAQASLARTALKARGLPPREPVNYPCTTRNMSGTCGVSHGAKFVIVVLSSPNWITSLTTCFLVRITKMDTFCQTHLPHAGSASYLCQRGATLFHNL